MSLLEDDERFDGLYMTVAQTAQGIDPLLDTVFGFLRRKTDFFAGPPGQHDPQTGNNGTDLAMRKVQQVMEKQGGYRWVDAAPRTLTAHAHRPAYGSDGDYFSKPNAEDIAQAVIEIMKE